MAVRIKDLLKDKTVLYVVCFIAFMNLLGYITLDNKDAVSLFLIIGLLTSFFSKNMIVISLSAMVFTNLLTGLRMHGHIREGMKDNKKNKSNDKPKSRPRKKEKKKQKESLRMIEEDDQTEESIRRDRAHVKPASESIEEVVTGRSDDIDQAATIEKAMDQLDRSLSAEEKDDFKKNARDTLKQQQQLMQNLKDLQPMADQATKMLTSLGGIDGLTKVMQGMGPLMNTLNGASNKLQ